MSNTEIYARLTSLFRDLFDDDAIHLDETTTAKDIDGWDSLSNIRMVLSVETMFGIRLSAAQVASLANVGDLVAVIASRMQQGAVA